MPIACASPKPPASVAAEMAKGRVRSRREIMTRTRSATRIVVLQAIGGSTNGVVHLTAIAGRTEHRVDLEEFDEIGREVPVLVDLKPSGDHYMEHFHYAGGVPRLMAGARAICSSSMRRHVTGGTLGDVVAAAEDVPGQTVIRPRKQSDQAGRRHGDPARQSRAARRRHQAVGGDAEAAAAHRPRGGVRIRSRT